MKRMIHIPLISRGQSGSSLDNVLIQESENIFIMDNHRLALWSWGQSLDKSKRYNLLHIDAHPDLSESGLSDFNLSEHDIWNLSLKDYREMKQLKFNEVLFRWDNYLEIFLKYYPQNIAETFSATHHLGSSKELKTQISSYELVKFTTDIFSEKKYINDCPWIVNLDLDYFYSAAPLKISLFSEAYIMALKESIDRGLKSGMIACLTIALSPECCGGWKNAEKMLKYFYQGNLE